MTKIKNFNLQPDGDNVLIEINISIQGNFFFNLVGRLFSVMYPNADYKNTKQLSSQPDDASEQ